MSNKKGQDYRYKICSAMPKKAQEEMIGFVLIVILVAIILLVLVGFSLRTEQREEVESYEVESFIQAMLQQTSDCKDNQGYLSIDKLIFGCANSESCLDGRGECLVLSDNLRGIVQESWRTENRPIAGYELKILNGEESLIPEMKEGNQTKNYKSSLSEFDRGGNQIQISFRAYY